MARKKKEEKKKAAEKARIEGLFRIAPEPEGP